MHDFIRLIPVEYFLLRRDFLKQLLSRMPFIRPGRHRGSAVYRVYNHNRSLHREVSQASRDWDKATALYKKRCKLEEMLKQTEVIISAYFRYIKAFDRKTSKVNIIPSKYDCKYYDNLVDSSCSNEKTSEYYYDGRNFRSRTEALIAAIIIEFGLEYKYDVKVILNGKEFTFDFAICFREFNRCIFFEYFGRCDENSYNHNNSIKFYHANADGAYVGRDLFIMSGDRRNAPCAEAIRIHLASIISQLTCIYLSPIEDNRSPEHIKDIIEEPVIGSDNSSPQNDGMNSPSDDRCTGNCTGNDDYPYDFLDYSMFL